VRFKLLDNQPTPVFNSINNPMSVNQSMVGHHLNHHVGSVKRCGLPAVILKKKDLYIVRRLQLTCSLLGCETKLEFEQEDHRDLQSRVGVEAGRSSQPVGSRKLEAV